MSADDPKLSLQQELDRTRGLERDLLTMLLDSRSKAWRHTWASYFISLVAIAIAAHVLFMFEPPPPLVVRVNDATGEIEHVTRLGDAVESYGERTDKARIFAYVMACESYDWNTIQNTYNQCGLFSSPDVQRAFHAKFQDNPKTGYEALDKRYANHTRLKPSVTSITLGPNNTATVRFTRAIEGPAQTPPPEHLVATVAYRYVNSDMKEKDRWLNPLGFQVVTYNPEIEVLR